MRSGAIVAEILLFGELLALALIGPIAAGAQWRRDSAHTKAAGWRKQAACLGVAAAVLQIGLLVAAWLPREGLDFTPMRSVARLMVPVFLAAFGLALTGSGAPRKLLAASSVALLILTFFAALSV